MTEEMKRGELTDGETSFKCTCGIDSEKNDAVDGDDDVMEPTADPRRGSSSFAMTLKSGVLGEPNDFGLNEPGSETL